MQELPASQRLKLLWSDVARIISVDWSNVPLFRFQGFHRALSCLVPPDPAFLEGVGFVVSHHNRFRDLPLLKRLFHPDSDQPDLLVRVLPEVGLR